MMQVNEAVYEERPKTGTGLKKEAEENTVLLSVIQLTPFTMRYNYCYMEDVNNTVN